MHEAHPPSKLDPEHADRLEKLIRLPIPSDEPNPMEVVGEVMREYLLLLVRAARGSSQITHRGDGERRILLLLTQRELGHWPEFDDVSMCLDAVMGSAIDLEPFRAAIEADLALLSPQARSAGLGATLPIQIP